MLPDGLSHQNALRATQCRAVGNPYNRALEPTVVGTVWCPIICTQQPTVWLPLDDTNQ